MTAIFEHFYAGKNLYEQMVMPVCKEYGLTYMEFTVLMFLVNNPQYDTAAQITKIRRLSKSHVSLSLRGLQAKGLVTGQYFPGNQKRLHLCVTETARPVVEQGKKAQKAFGAQLIRGFAEEEVEQLQSFIDRIHENMKQEEISNAEE